MAWLALCVFGASTYGCAELRGLKPAPFRVEEASPASVALEVEYQMEGQSSIPLLTLVSFDVPGYRKALAEAIVESGVFGKIADREGADFILRVIIARYSNHVSFGSMTTKWILLKPGSTDPISTVNLSTSATASIFEAFNGIKKARLILERLVRGNIASGLRRLARENRSQSGVLKLQSPSVSVYPLGVTAGTLSLKLDQSETDPSGILVATDHRYLLPGDSETSTRCSGLEMFSR